VGKKGSLWERKNSEIYIPALYLYVNVMRIRLLTDKRVLIYIHYIRLPIFMHYAFILRYLFLVYTHIYGKEGVSVGEKERRDACVDIYTPCTLLYPPS
jgi:hypothetical protein